VAYTSEIEKLERRYAENPKGRNFAPLADAYRKEGQVDQAIELCQTGLGLHPDYVSAHIVYGRCLMDKKDDAGAEGVFRKVLELDPENILALRVLAEISERTHRLDQAVEWLGRLLNADPMNGDAAEALARAKTRAAAAAKVAVPAAEPVAQLQPELDSEPLADTPTDAMEKPDFAVEHVSVPEPAPSPPPSRPSGVAPAAAAGEIETYDGSIDFNAAAHAAAKADGIEMQEEVELKPDVAPLEGLARTQYEGSGVFKVESASADAPPPPAAAAPIEEFSTDLADDMPVVDLPLFMPEDVEPTVVARVPEAAPPPPTPSRRASTPAPPPAAVLLSDDDGAADTAALSRAEPVLTETMAELYLKQGHREEALRVYQALSAQRPGDARLRGRIESLSGRAGGGGSRGVSAGAFLKGVFSGKGGRATSPPTSMLDGAFGPVTVEDPVAQVGAPTRPAEDAISLDSVFGDAAGGDGGAAAAPATEPAHAPGGGVEGPPASGGFSFDEFFNPAAGGPPAASPSAPRASGRQSRPAEPPEEEGDLDQFQAWLKGLKS
jgi:tetratricopeptide (TPR) repeat protein